MPLSRGYDTAVWTGSEMIVWVDTTRIKRWKIRAATNSWTATSLTTPPTHEVITRQSGPAANDRLGGERRNDLNHEYGHRHRRNQSALPESNMTWIFFWRRPEDMSMPAGRFTPFTMTYRWKRKRPILPNTRTVTINPAQTMTNSRLRTAMTNIQSPLLDPADAAEYRRSSS